LLWITCDPGGLSGRHTRRAVRSSDAFVRAADRELGRLWSLDSTEPSQLDLDVLARLVGGDRALVERFAKRFVGATRAALDGAAAARDACDAAALAALGHKLASSAAAVGALAFSAHCRAMESAARSGESTRAVSEFDALVAELAAIASRVEREFA
jgi:HPt (histidine-containing phosphotransfer) domain-containing protein